MSVFYFIGWAQRVSWKTQRWKMSLCDVTKGTILFLRPPAEGQQSVRFSREPELKRLPPLAANRGLILPSLPSLSRISRLLTQPVLLCAQTMWAAGRCSLICTSGITSPRRPCVFTSGKSSWLWSICTRFVPLPPPALLPPPLKVTLTHFRHCGW